MLRNYFLESIEDAIDKAVKAGDLGQMSEYTVGSIKVETPKNPDFGDLAVNVSPLARSAKIAPPMIANKILEYIEKNGNEYTVVGGFINFKAGKDILNSTIEEILNKKEKFGCQCRK